MTRPNANKRRFGRGDGLIHHASQAPLNVDPLAARRRILWDRAVALGLNLADAAAYVAGILRSEGEEGLNAV